MGPWGTFIRIVLASMAVTATLAVAGRAPGLVWLGAPAGAVAGLFGAAVESTLGPTLHLGLRWLLWALLTALTVYSVSLLWPHWAVSPWAPLWAGMVTGLVEVWLPTDWLRQ
jgi:hypothetical protein